MDGFTWAQWHFRDPPERPIPSFNASNSLLGPSFDARVHFEMFIINCGLTNASNEIAFIALEYNRGVKMMFLRCWNGITYFWEWWTVVKG